MRPRLLGRRRQPAILRRDQLRQVVVGDGHALGGTGRAGGVDDVGDVVGCGRRQRRAGLAVNGGIVDIDDDRVEPAEPVGEVGGGDGGERCRVGRA